MEIERKPVLGKKSALGKNGKPPLQVLSTVRGKKSCGHEDDFKILKGEKPEFATRRREKWDGKICTTCLNENQKKIQAEAAIARAVRKAAQARLPDGSVFHATYSAASELWSGTLSVPGSSTVEGTCSSIANLPHRLALLWAAFQKKKK